MPASWNQIASWVQQIDGLRRVPGSSLDARPRCTGMYEHGRAILTLWRVSRRRRVRCAMDNPTTVVILGVIVLGAWLWRRRRSGASRQAETQLRRICLGNDGQVDRLINHEMTRTPGISRAEAASRAVRRYQRDNR